MLDNLPPEMVFEILLELPIKSLIKFITVHKSWKSLIKSSSFTHTHLTRRNTDYTSLLLFKVIDRVQNSYHEHCLLHNPETGDSSRLVYPPPPVQLLAEQVIQLGFEPGFNVHGTCNGLIYLSWFYRYWAIIWNPSIRKYVHLPNPRFGLPPLRCSLFTAFGYDIRAKDYKVLNILSNKTQDVACDVEVYSLARGSWRTLVVDVVPQGYIDFGNGVLLKGFLYWFRSGSFKDNCIVTFDMHHEVFGEMVVPDAIAVLREGVANVTRYGESLAIVNMALMGDGSGTKADVWVRSVDGAGESWSVLYSVTLNQFHPFADFVPYASGLVLNMYEAGLFYANSRGAVRVDVGWDRVFVGSYVESLELLCHANAISY